MHHSARQRFAHISRTVLACALLSGFAVSAQAPGDIRVALVIGNAAYAGNTALLNPGNDAKAMAETLRKLGFTVVELRDGNKAQMTEAIGKVRERLKGMQGIGMLYYAGHGLQLDWHNYMVPVDARLGNSSDVPLQTVDVSAVIDAFKAAGNRMNILVLDACRDSPFASNGTASGKGLAQLDAPPGTFLAFATAPGNVAEDGDASSGNGLYTQYLLQELNKPIAKIEDVFKRVRLNVRQKSQGRQVPWESTSLEDDFFFNDGSTIKPEDLERQASEAKQREQQLLQKANEAREREKQIALALEKERQEQAQAAKLAEEQRLVAERQAKEAERLAGVAREQEQKRLTAEAKVREEQRLVQEAQAKQRERQLAELQAKERAQQVALAQAQEAEARKQEELRQVAAEAKAREAARQLSKDHQRDQAFAIEKAAWDNIKDSKNPDDFYSFLRQFPNGLISEFAGAKLEQLAESKVNFVADRHGVKQTREPRYRVGDHYEYLVQDGQTLAEIRRDKRTVTQIRNGLVDFNYGKIQRTIDGAWLNARDVRVFDPPRANLPAAEFSVGLKWSGRSIQTNSNGRVLASDTHVQIVALEEIVVPAGKFKAYKFVMNSSRDNGSQIRLIYWAEPGWGEPLKLIREIRNGQNKLIEWQVFEMTARQRGAG